MKNSVFRGITLCSSLTQSHISMAMMPSSSGFINESNKEPTLLATILILFSYMISFLILKMDEPIPAYIDSNRLCTFISQKAHLITLITTLFGYKYFHYRLITLSRNLKMFNYKWNPKINLVKKLMRINQARCVCVYMPWWLIFYLKLTLLD